MSDDDIGCVAGGLLIVALLVVMFVLDDKSDKACIKRLSRQPGFDHRADMYRSRECCGVFRDGSVKCMPNELEKE